MKAIAQGLVAATVTARQATSTQLLVTTWLAIVALLIAMQVGPAGAATSASQTPLYTGTPGAKPNVMFVLDDSSSMNRQVPEIYPVRDNCREQPGCPGYGWYAMRSSSVNTQHYDPAVTYKPRVNPDGTPQTNPLTFVDNQFSGLSYAPLVLSYQPPLRIPGGSRFIYVVCAPDTVPCADPAPTKRRVVTINFPLDTAPIPLPSPNNRTDPGCGNGTCTQEAELRNILNWYYWYGSRLKAVSTATGQALQGYDDKFRVGYSVFSNSRFGNRSITRGVRYFRDDRSTAGNDWKTQFYRWLYGVKPDGETPTHYALSVAADYYRGSSRATHGNPWKNDPTSVAVEDSSDLSCRRSYAILLSDGAWNAGTSVNAATQFASLPGASFPANPPGSAPDFQFQPSGASGSDSSDMTTRLAARNLYIPYSDGRASQYGLADLTALYFWNTDFSALPDNVPPIPGQRNPTYWQNMTTFTIGWGLTPSGEAAGATGGLRWDQINRYNNDWLAGRANPVPPAWPTGDLDNPNILGRDPQRVDDFIRAGFTGGGRAFSVYSGEDVRKAIDNILGSIVAQATTRAWRFPATAATSSR